MPSDPDRENVRLVLDLDLAGDPPSGRLVDEQGSVSDFSGWLQLMDGVEGARQRAAGGERPDPPGEGDQRGGQVDDKV